MNRTKIEWVKNPDGTQGYTWNPITGCLNGCEYCYARKLANGRLKSRYLANENLAPSQLGKIIHAANEIYDPFYPRFWEDRLYEPVNKIRRRGRQTSVLHQQRPKGIFVCDMSDLFGIGIPEEWTRKILDRLQYASQHRFYLLTKQPQNLIKFSPFPDNCWVGVTAITNAHLLLAIGQLEKIEAKIKYLSIEPMLYELDGFKFAINNAVNQVIIGAQTKPYKPPKVEWVQEIVEACDKARIPMFLKDNLRPILKDLPKSCIRWSGWGEGTHRELRQEMPICQKPQ